MKQQGKKFVCVLYNMSPIIKIVLSIKIVLLEVKYKTSQGGITSAEESCPQTPVPYQSYTAHVLF